MLDFYVDKVLWAQHLLGNFQCENKTFISISRELLTPYNSHWLVHALLISACQMYFVYTVVVSAFSQVVVLQSVVQCSADLQYYHHRQFFIFASHWAIATPLTDPCSSVEYKCMLCPKSWDCLFILLVFISDLSSKQRAQTFGACWHCLAALPS